MKTTGISFEEAVARARRAIDNGNRRHPDWIVSHIVDRGPKHYYRYHVSGVNLSADDARDERFEWNVPSLSERYELSAAKLEVQ